MVRLVSRFPAPEQRHPEQLRSPPCGGVFLGSARTASPSAAWGLWFDLATGNAQRLWMSITGSSSGDI